MQSPLLQPGRIRSPLSSPLLRKTYARSDKVEILRPPQISTSFISFFIFPLRYLLIHNKKIDEFMKLGKNLKFANNYEDLPPLLQMNDIVDDDIEAQCNRMEQIWLASRDNPTPMSVYSLAYHTIPKQIHMIFISLFLDATFRLLYSFLMGSTISCLSRYIYASQHIMKGDDQTLLEELRWETLYTSMAMIAVILCYIYVERLFFALSIQSGMKLRLIFVLMLYRKLHRISLSALNEVSLGKFLNIISSDVALMDHGLTQGTIVVIAPFILVVGLIMMWSHFGALSLLSIGIIFLYMPLQSLIIKRIEAPKKRKNKFADDRLKIMGEIIESIRILKQYTWEQLFMQMALSIRTEEDKAQTSIQQVRSFTTSLSNTSIYVSLLTTIYFYSIVGGNDLTANKILSSILILSIMRAWCVQKFSDGIMFVVQFGLAQQRIIDVLNIQEIQGLTKKKTRDLSHQVIEMTKVISQTNQEPILSFENYSGFWSKESLTLNKPVLQNININMTHEMGSSKLTCIIGKIGSGKTSLLLSILKEIPYQEGEIKLQGSISYVEQEPYVFQGTIRENILFGCDYDPEVYGQVIMASCLYEDLRALPLGDLSYVGERGITLSGGQRARLSFARALYSNSDIYILDDPLSAVDAKVARILFTKGIKQYLRGKIVVLVTHHIHFAVESNWMVVMHEGTVRAQGPPTEVLGTLGSEFQQYIENTAQQRQSIGQKTDDPELNMVLSQLSVTMSVHSDQVIEEEEDKQIQEVIKPTIEDKQVMADMQHEVTWKTVMSYISYGGGLQVFIKIYLLYATESLAVILTNRLFGYWAKDNEDKINNPQKNLKTNHMIYFKIVFCFLLIIQVLSYYKFQKLQRRILLVATNIYIRMVEVIVRAKVAYFDRTASGQVLSRFTSDLTVAEQMLSYFLQINMDGFTSLILVTLTVCLVNPIIFIPSSVFFCVLYYIKKTFQQYLGYTRNCDSATRGPLNTEASSTLNGLIVIRAYQKADIFIEKFQKIVYRNTQASMGFTRISITLALILDLALFVQITIGTGLLIFMGLRESGSKDIGELGFSLLLLIQIGDNFSTVFRSFFLIEINLNHVERMFALTRVQPEAALETAADAQMRSDWPALGDIEFRNVSMKYDLMRSELSGSGDQFALRNLNFKIPHGCKVGIVGRTGAGKSSLLQALFRMVEIEPGSMNEGIFLDDVNINQLGLHYLRKKISIIPQQPVVFQGTIRRNLDPLNTFSDETIYEALDEVGLKEKIMLLDKQLNTDMTISANVFSVGQKQLICLARAMLQDNKIVVFDEATSNVDLKTDRYIQTKIKQRFRNCTVMTIAHRLETIADYDRILVMDHGQISEYDHPFKLLVHRDTDSTITNLQGDFASMVLNTGKAASNKIFKIAQNAYMQILTQ